MNYIISRDVTMTLYALALFLLVFLLHRLIAKIRHRRLSAYPYIIGAVVTAAWEYLYSAGDWWKNNNGLLGAYLMLALPVIGVTAAAVVCVVLGNMQNFSEK